MNEYATQAALFDEPIGLQLTRARQKNGLSTEQVGQQLKLPIAIIEAMEREDWPRLGAPLYVRSYLGSYLRLVGLPAELAERVATGAASPRLVSMASRSRMRHTFDRSLRNIVYLVMTAVLVVPVVLVVRHYQAADRPASLTLEPEAVLREAGALEEAAPAPTTVAPLPRVAQPAGGETSSGETPPPPASVEPAPARPDPVMASLVPAAATTDGLVLRFVGESWVDVVDARGQRIERGLVAAGQERRFGPGQVARITLGNADAVEVRAAGRAIDLAPYRSANVARFAVSSSGEIETPGQ